MTRASRNDAAFIAKYMSPNEFIDSNAVYGFGAAATMIQVLKQCGNDLSRDNVMKQAANLKDLELPMTLPGIKINTSPDQLQPDPTGCSSRRSTARAGSCSGSCSRLERRKAARVSARAAFSRRLVTRP